MRRRRDPTLDETVYCVTVTYIFIQIHQTVEVIDTTTGGCIFNACFCTFILHFHAASFIFHDKPAKFKHLLNLKLVYTVHILRKMYFSVVKFKTNFMNFIFLLKIINRQECSFKMII